MKINNYTHLRVNKIYVHYNKHNLKSFVDKIKQTKRPVSRSFITLSGCVIIICYFILLTVCSIWEISPNYVLT